MIITNHALERYNERVREHSTKFLVEQVAENAFNYGKLPIQFYDEDKELFGQLQRIQTRYGMNEYTVKVLQDIAFIFAKANKLSGTKLITLYKIR